MIKQLDRMQRVAVTNAFAELEEHGVVEKSNFFCQKNDKDVWAYIIGNKSVRITEIDKNTFELEVLTHE